MAAPAAALAVLLNEKLSEAVAVAIMLAVGDELSVTEALTLCVATFVAPLAPTSLSETV